MIPLRIIDKVLNGWPKQITNFSQKMSLSLRPGMMEWIGSINVKLYNQVSSLTRITS